MKHNDFSKIKKKRPSSANASAKRQAKYDFARIEKYWQTVWRKEGVYEPDMKRAKKPFYNLMMFPYPSAEGLHVGNMYAFTGADIYGRFKRMQGNDVFEPIGLDGFGIHSENYALKIGTHPMKQSKVSEKRFYKQLELIGNGYAWSHHLETYDPEYYKWTQWVFLQLFKAGLAYRKKQPVNWCPSCKTVLANEQVINGRCERCGTAVIKKDLEQWFFKITKYSDRLLKNLEKIDWSEKVKIAQRNWIGRKEGIEIAYEIEGIKENVAVFTTRPDTNFGATFIVIAPENSLALRITAPRYKKEVERYILKTGEKSEEDRIIDGRKKTGAFTGRYAINHFTGFKMPIWVADFVLGDFGTGAVVGVPGHDIRDFEFATEFGLKIIRVVKGESGDTSPISRRDQVQEKKGTMMNSGFLDGMDIHKATIAIMDYMEEKGWGKRVVQHRLRDWLISRQRYWGPPIPMIFCEACKERIELSNKRSDRTSEAIEQAKRYNVSIGELENPGWIPVPEKELPVKLPFVKDFRPRGKGKSPLASVESFYEVKCPRCGSDARRETDVSDTFLDSAWYYLRYPSTGSAGSPRASLGNKKVAWDPSMTKKWLPVNMYIGGAEHSVLHLLYVRFLAMVFNDMKLINFEEPFPKFRAHGLLIKDSAKMSKSKGNVVNPDEYVKKFGADALRMYLMFIAPFEDGGDFQDNGISGITRFLGRVWQLGIRRQVSLLHQDFGGRAGIRENAIPNNAEKLLHQTIKKVTEDIESLHYNTAISALMILLNELEKDVLNLTPITLNLFLKLLAPFAPHMTEELWQRSKASGKFKSIHLEPWPEYDPKLIKEKTFMLIIQVNGKMRDSVEVPVGITSAKAQSLALASGKVKTFLSEANPKRVIYVPGRLVNIVV
jgi:leucyl-tRNA synthetase